MKFGVHLLANLTPEWNSQYIQYEEMKELLEKAVAEAPVLVNDVDDDNNNQSICEEYYFRVDQEFFEYCAKQLTKVNTFFTEKLAEALRRFTTLKDEIQHRKLIYGQISPCKKPSVSIIRKSNRVNQYGDEKPMNRILSDRFVKGTDKQRKHHMQHKDLTNLKTAVSEYYLMLVLLQKYQLLNYTGFVKILKKHDKLFQTTGGAEWRKMHIDTATFYKSSSVTELIRDVERIYIDELESGDRARAMKRLRVPPLEEKQSSMVTFRLGIFIGTMCVLLPMVIILIIFFNKSQSGKALAWREALHLYRSPFLIILQIILAGINVYGWSSSGVNHILIFEIDPRHHLTYQQLLETGTCLGVLWCLSFITFILTSYIDFYPFLHPLIFVILMIVFLINPAPIFYRSARYWLLRALGLVISAAFHPIRFADNWLCNQITSIELAFYDLEYFFCFYFSNHQWWSTKLISSSSPENVFCTGWTKYLLQGFLLATPSLLRLTQCLRRYYDTRLKFPHLVNAGKYSVGVAVAITNSLRRGTIALDQTHPNSPETNPFVYLWIIVALINSTYKILWDIKMDWGLFNKNAGENRFLRDHIIYSSKKYYYYAMIQEVVFRYSWTINIFIQFHSGAAEYSDVIGFCFGLIELFRRFTWNFFRLENEHLNNCGRYRAVRDISVKPLASDTDFVLNNFQSNKKSNIRNRFQKTQCQTITEENNETTINDLENNIEDFVRNQMSTSRAMTIVEMNTRNQTSDNLSSRRCHSLSSLDKHLVSSYT